MFIKVSQTKKNTYSYLMQAFRNDQGRPVQRKIMNVGELSKEDLDEALLELTKYRTKHFGPIIAGEASSSGDLPGTYPQNQMDDLFPEEITLSAMTPDARIQPASCLFCRFWNWLRKLFCKNKE